MNTEKQYELNPYVSIYQTNQVYILNSLDENRLVFNIETDGAFVKWLMETKTVTLKEIKHYLDEEQIQKLVDYKVLLDGAVPSLEGKYSRQEGFLSHLTHDFKRYGEKMAQANVLILGAGAIGTHALWNFISMGVRRITLLDFDVVEESNLNRQLFYDYDDIGKVKVEAIAEKVKRLDPNVAFTIYNAKINSPEDIEQYVKGKDFVLKAIDSPEKATTWVNKVCVEHKIPYISGGFLEYQGVIGPIYVPGETVCSACIGQQEIKRIGGVGPTFGPLTTIVSSRIAMLAFKMIVGHSIGEAANQMLFYDTQNERWNSVSLVPATICPVCGFDPATVEPEIDKGQLWRYRGLIFAVAIVTTLARIYADFQLAGPVAMVCLAVSLFLMVKILKDRDYLIYKEIFNLSCIYSSVALLATGITTFKWQPELIQFSLAGYFDLLQTVSTFFVTVGMLITFIFIVMSIMYTGINKSLALIRS